MDESKKPLRFSCQCCKNSRIVYDEIEFNVVYEKSVMIVSLDDENYCEIRQKNQQVPYKATILGGFALATTIVGEIDFNKYFRVEWNEETLSMPIIIFLKNPRKVQRTYWKGGSLELGLENEKDYQITYVDGITAEYKQIHSGEYAFSFSTGFHGLIRKETDGSHTINFKGDIIDKEITGYAATSKFIISRSKFTNNLVLYFQEDAVVSITLE